MKTSKMILNILVFIVSIPGYFITLFGTMLAFIILVWPFLPNITPQMSQAESYSLQYVPQLVIVTWLDTFVSWLALFGVIALFSYMTKNFIDIIRLKFDLEHSLVLAGILFVLCLSWIIVGYKLASLVPIIIPIILVVIAIISLVLEFFLRATFFDD